MAAESTPAESCSTASREVNSDASGGDAVMSTESGFFSWNKAETELDQDLVEPPQQPATEESLHSLGERRGRAPRNLVAQFATQGRRQFTKRGIGSIGTKEL